MDSLATNDRAICDISVYINLHQTKQYLLINIPLICKFCLIVKHRHLWSTFVWFLFIDFGLEEFQNLFLYSFDLGLSVRNSWGEMIQKNKNIKVGSWDYLPFLAHKYKFKLNLTCHCQFENASGKGSDQNLNCLEHLIW